MKRILSVMVTAFLVLFPASRLSAGNSDTQTVTMQVNAINEFSVSGNPPSFVISTATPGFEPDSVLDQTTTYNLTTNQTSKKITAVLDVDMPPNTWLKSDLAPPPGATGFGMLGLSSVASDLVSNINQVAQSGLGIKLQFDCTVLAGTMSAFTRTVTYTLQD